MKKGFLLLLCCLIYSKLNNKGRSKSFHSTCLYCDHFTFRAVAHEVGRDDVRCVVGAALQALDLAAHINGVAAVNDAFAVLSHGDVKNCTAAADPGHCDGVSPTFFHS